MSTKNPFDCEEVDVSDDTVKKELRRKRATATWERPNRFTSRPDCPVKRYSEPKPAVEPTTEEVSPVVSSAPVLPKSPVVVPVPEHRHILFSIRESLIDFDEFLVRKIPPRKFYMEPWLKENTINIISAQKGVGKSMLVESIAVALTHGESIGTWKVTEPSSVLLIDGEMAQEDLYSRFKGLSKGMKRKADFTILSADDMASRGLKTPSIASSEWRGAIFDTIMGLKPAVVILDNVSSLASGLDENSKKEWDPVNQWLIQLRGNGITVIIVFHLGKDTTRGVRGHSGIQDSVDTILELSNVKGHKHGEPASFNISFEKSRGLMEGASEKVTISYQPETTGKISWSTSDSKAKLLNKGERAIVCLAHGKTPKEIVAHGICTRQYASKVKKEAQEGSILKADCTLSMIGRGLYGNISFDEVWG